MAQTIITSPFTENRMVISVTHTSHGFDSGDLGKPMRSSGVNGRFVVAQADSATNAEVVGVLTSVEDVNNYTITSTGIVDAAAAIPDAATAGQVLFVSQTADTVLTTTEPTAVGQVSKPVAVIIEQNAKMLLIHYRGEVITSTTQTNAPNDATYLTTSANSTLSNEVVVGGSVGSSITVADADGFVVNDGGTVKVIPATDIKTYAQAIKIDDLTAGDDNTDLDSSASRHGLLRKLDGTTTNFLRGDGAWAAAGSTFIGCKVYHNANQNVSNGSETALSFNSEDWDTDAMHDNSTNNTRITFKTAGKYFIQGHVQVADIVDGSGNTAGRRHLAIRLNGGNRNVVSQSSPSLSDQWAHQASVMLDVSVNDYVELLFLQSSGETLAVQYNNGSPFFTAYKLD